MCAHLTRDLFAIAKFLFWFAVSISFIYSLLLLFFCCIPCIAVVLLLTYISCVLFNKSKYILRLFEMQIMQMSARRNTEMCISSASPRRHGDHRSSISLPVMYFSLRSWMHFRFCFRFQDQCISVN